MSAPDSNNPYQSPTAETTNPPGPYVPDSELAPCPGCRQVGAKKVNWTLWGGAVGPWMFNHVKCHHCGTTFNGKTGQSNNTAIAIYIAVSLGISVLIFGVFACGGLLG